MIENADIPDSKNSLSLDGNAIEHLKEARKWTAFLSIAGFVMIGLMVCILIITGIIAGKHRLNPVGTLPFVSVLPILIMVIIYTFPIYYLYQFSRYSKLALRDLDQDALSNAFKYLKIHYRYMGVLLIAVIGIYAVTLVFFISKMPAWFWHH